MRFKLRVGIGVFNRLLESLSRGGQLALQLAIGRPGGGVRVVGLELVDLRAQRRDVSTKLALALFSRFSTIDLLADALLDLFRPSRVIIIRFTASRGRAFEATVVGGLTCFRLFASRR